MTVKELIERLQALDANTRVFASDNCGGSYLIGDVEYDESTNTVELY